MPPFNKTAEYQEGVALRYRALRFKAIYGGEALLSWLYAMLVKETGLGIDDVLPSKKGENEHE